jgi:hypothetical protein
MSMYHVEIRKEKKEAALVTKDPNLPVSTHAGEQPTLSVDTQDSAYARRCSYCLGSMVTNVVLG